jgi:predicted transposase YbfD/YdcC
MSLIEASILTHFSLLDDPRDKRGKEHLLLGIVTIAIRDYAKSCQRGIAAAIIEQGADYVLALKDNQPTLFEDVQWLFEQAQARQFQEVVHDVAQSVDQGHGRIEVRRCWTLSGAELDCLNDELISFLLS